MRWIVTMIVILVVAAVLVQGSKTNYHSISPRDPVWVPRVGEPGAPRLPGQCGQVDQSNGSMHRIECPAAPSAPR